MQWTFEDQPDVIICPLMKTRIPPELYENQLTLVVHPGPPGDRGASSLDWCVKEKKTVWGVTVLEAVEDFDAGNVWGYDKFSVKDDDTKSSIYRNQVQYSGNISRKFYPLLQRYRNGHVSLNGCQIDLVGYPLSRSAVLFFCFYPRILFKTNFSKS